jgi:archaemetzincin
VSLAPVQLIEVGAALPHGLTARLARNLERALRTACSVRRGRLDPAFALLPGRGQFHSHRILARLAEHAPAGGARLVGVTALDLCVPVFAYVFGEAQLGGACAVVSLYRLREEFYGLPENQALLEERLLKETLHEIGHTLGLPHCDDWRCIMSPSHVVERLDLKQIAVCSACRLSMPVF